MSGGVGTSQADLDLRALEDFLVGNRDVERLEALLDRFNILEALGVVRQELRHSDFLAFLMDPKGNHGLGDAFVKRLLQRTLTVAGDVTVPLTPIELELWSLDRIEVRREWNYIDVLLLDEDHELAVIVENKIGTKEHSDQLRRYHLLVEQDYPGWRVVALYLTPDGDVPSHASYLPVDYGLVCEVMDGLAEDRASVLSPDLVTLMTHYTDMLRRNIVGDSDVARLCREIYRKHKRALDLIYAHRPDLRLVTQGLLVGLIESAQSLVYKGKVRNNLFFFRPPEWDEVPAFNAGEAVYGFFRFVFHKRPDGLDLYLETSPGDDEVRVKLYEMGQKDGDLFNHLEDPETHEYPKLYRRTFLDLTFNGDAINADLETEIQRHWTEFLRADLPQIDAALKEEHWIWEAADPDQRWESRH